MNDKTIKRVVREGKEIKSMQNELFVFLLTVEKPGTLPVLELHFMVYSSKDLFQIKRDIEKAYL